MTTDFNYNNKTIDSSGPIKPSGTDQPGDPRTRVDFYSDIESIPNPYVGMIVTVKIDETNQNKMTDYKVLSLKANTLGIPNSVIDRVQKYSEYLGVTTGGGTGLTPEQEAKLNSIDDKVDKIDGKGLSTEDFTTEEKTTLVNLKTTVGDSSSGLVKDVEDLKSNGVSQDNINSAVSDYLSKNPIDIEKTIYWENVVKPPYWGLLLDCARKYFSVDNIKILIDKISEAGLNQLILHFSEDTGFRFGLDDMIFTDEDGKTYDLSNSLGGSENSSMYYTQADMDEIIEYAQSKGIDIVPSLDMPSHIGKLIANVNIPKYNGIDFRNNTSIKFAKAVVDKYCKYFFSRGCHFWNIGADEVGGWDTGFKNIYRNGEFGYLINFINTIAKVVKDNGLIPRIFDEPAFYNSDYRYIVDKDIEILFWCRTNIGQLATAEEQQRAGYKVINCSGDYYWVLNNSSLQIKADRIENADLLTDFRTVPSRYNGYGAVFCIWCDAATGAGAGDGGDCVIEPITPLITAFGNAIKNATSTKTSFKIYNVLNNCSTNNNATDIVASDSYNSVITANSGYALNKVKVYVGEEDVTSTVYLNGNISISSVTGNILIKANAISTTMTYTITNNLTNVTSDNNVKELVSGSSYTATLTPITDEYTLSTVTVTMGGADITSSAYSDGVITIPSVIGNIIITATAVSNTVGTITYTITNNLTNCTNSNSNTSIDENSSYNATLTANDGYSIDTVTVTMGGNDITSTVYNSSNNSVAISSVTGNVVITANATSTGSSSQETILGSSYTWQKGYINSNGSIVTTSSAGLVSDYIPVEGGSVYTIKDNANYVNNIKIAEYDVNKSLVVRQIDKFDSTSYTANLSALNSTTKYILVAIEISSGVIDTNAKNNIIITKQ